MASQARTRDNELGPKESFEEGAAQAWFESLLEPKGSIAEGLCNHRM